jgi:DNA-binding transcriptional MerR regulator
MLIGAVARMTGSNVPTIRYYEEIGLLPEPQRAASGQRVYAEADVERLTFIKRCRQFGFSIDQTRSLVSLVQSPSRNCLEARDLAETHLNDIRSKVAELQQLERSLAVFVDSCNEQCAGGPASDCVILDDLTKPEGSACCGPSRSCGAV